MNLRYFSTVVPEAQQGTEENLIDLILSVEEQSTSSVQFGVTFSGASEASGSMLPVSLFAKVEKDEKWTALRDAVYSAVIKAAPAKYSEVFSLQDAVNSFNLISFSFFNFLIFSRLVSQQQKHPQQEL